MILRLRHALPWLQKFGGWSVFTTPPPLTRRFAAPGWTTATLAPGAADTDSQADNGAALQSGIAAEAGPDKKRRRSSRTTTITAAADGEKSAPEAPAASERAGEGDSTPTKRRNASRRKAAAATSGSEGAEQASVEPTATATSPPKRTRRKRQDEDPPPSAVAAATIDAASLAEADTEARRRSGAKASSRGGSADASSAHTKKRASRSTSKRATATGAVVAAKEISDEEETKDEERASVQSLPYEEFLVLPRKAEHILVALGLRPPPEDTATTGLGDGAASSPPPSLPGRGGSIGSVLELASYLGRPDPKELVAPLLIAQYQGYLGSSPDYLYDLFYLDYDPPYLASAAVRNAVISAARTVTRASALLSAKGAPPEALARAALDRLQADVGAEAVAAQEGRAPRLTEAQLELFLLDWASARLAGLRGEAGLAYLARRSAALQLTRPIVVERLVRYAVQGDNLEELAAGSAGGARSVRLSQPMDALIEGLKAGVRLDPERLMRDFRLTSPGSPVAEHLADIRRAVVHEAGRSLEPGSSMYYSTLVERLHVHPGLRAAIRQQESQWQREQGERDGSALTQAQVRLLFHLWRRERFRDEEQARRMSQAAAASGGAA